MPRIRLFHWKAAEAAPLREILEAAGHCLDYDEKWTPEVPKALRSSPPDAFVIDLSRLPSHGREIAIFLRGAKATRAIPLMFVNGLPDKVTAIREQIPDASYTTTRDLARALGEALANPPAHPVVPAQMMERYAGRTTAQKLGIAADAEAAVLDPPRDYARVVGELPPGAALIEDGEKRCAVTLWFVRDADALGRGLARIRSLAGHTKLWIAWPKGSPAVNQAQIREAALAIGLVDYKICSLDKTWSALLFALSRKP